MNKLDHDIQRARPPFRIVSPLAAVIVLGFGITNLLLAYGMATYVNPTPHAFFPVITPYTTFKAWAVVFMVLGTLQLWSYYRNNWKWMQNSLLAGVAVKSIWLISLFIRWLTGGSILLLVIWFFFLYVQIMTFIHFMPLTYREPKDE